MRGHYLALAKMSQGWLLFMSGNLEQAGIVLDEVPEGPLRDARWLQMAGNVHLFTGQLDRAWEDCSRLSQPTLSHSQRAEGLYCQVKVLVVQADELPAEANASQISIQARKAKREAEIGGNSTSAAWASWPLILLANGAEAASSEFRRCLDAATGDSARRICRRALIRWQVSSARTTSTEPIGVLSRLDLEDPISRAEAYGDLMRATWKTRPFESFVIEAQQALSEIERLRAQQPGTATQTSLLSVWSDDYYWFAGRLLEAAFDRRCPSCLDLAFGVVERLRARALYDSLSAAGAGSPAAEADAGRLSPLAQAIERVRKRRQDSSLSPSERENAESDLSAFTEQRELLRRHADVAGLVGSTNSAVLRKRAPEFATLSRIQQQLDPDQAMLSFQIAPWKDWTGDFGGGSWLVVATRATRRCYRLEMGRGDLRQRVADFVERRSRSQSWKAAELYRQLLGSALSELPPGIKRLIVVPDDHLHRLPFAALRETPNGRPIAWRYQISIVPSATLWALTRAAVEPQPAARPALVLADPPTPAPGVQRTFEATGIHLPVEPLPAARREAKALVRFLGWSCERWVGNQASEQALLDTRETLSRFALVHFAAHSIVDDRDPSRSGIWLSPSPGHDGLLRPADIAKLGLDGRLIVLSTCSSNGGPFFRGEGVMSLAHAFFQARARTVVASLWPQLDTDAETLLTDFYRHLGQGASVAASLRLAQLDLLRQNPRLPPAAWAGMVVLGDGDLVPFPGGRHPWAVWQLAAGAVAALLLGFLTARMIRARRP
ncbi:MAG TPA: CHAT domain-containing protein [Thermoanaerobaculia bacterium]|jgi:CHAT domain-containing protein|nr:CHAT domain-containing protein [Thermoanaerobaculia bacterium]